MSISDYMCAHACLVGWYKSEWNGRKNIILLVRGSDLRIKRTILGIQFRCAFNQIITAFQGPTEASLGCFWWECPLGWAPVPSCSVAQLPSASWQGEGRHQGWHEQMQTARKRRGIHMNSHNKMWTCVCGLHAKTVCCLLPSAMSVWVTACAHLWISFNCLPVVVFSTGHFILLSICQMWRQGRWPCCTHQINIRNKLPVYAPDYKWCVCMVNNMLSMKQLWSMQCTYWLCTQYSTHAHCEHRLNVHALYVDGSN